MLRAILLVVVLVLDSPWGGNRSRAGEARRPVRTEPLPTALIVALCLEQSFSSSSSFSFSIRLGGNRCRAGEARRPGSDGASPYPLERRSMLRTILLVVVVVLDSAWGATVAARVRRAARFGRSLSLPP